MRRYFQIVCLVLGLGAMTPAQMPADWTVNPAEYEHVMTVTAVLKVNNQIANESTNVIAAFVGPECRGTATSMLTSGQQMYYLMVYSNTSGETIRFKTYYQPLDSVLNNTNTVTFNSNAAYGSPDSPYELLASYQVVGIDSDNPFQSRQYTLYQNYPNPFNASTMIRYEIPQSGQVILMVFDLQGNCVQNLVNDYREAGTHQLQWNVQGVSSGVYYYLLQTSGQVLKRCCIYIK